MLSNSLKLIRQKLKNYFWHLPKSIYFNFKYHSPAKKLILIGITGTDGKTTTCTFIHHLLTNSGIKAGLITTLGAKIGDKELNTGLHTTSPDSSKVQFLLDQMVKEGITHAVVEVTAHALDQFRYYGCRFNIAVITNTSQEHLDDFVNMARYIQAKAKIFLQSDFAVINKDDSSYQTINRSLSIPQVSYSIEKKSDYQAVNIKVDDNKLSFSVNNLLVTTDSNYYYQTYNILAAFAVCEKLGINRETFLSTVKHFPLTKGRREELPNKLKIKMIIDFAHTPAALEKTLTSLKNITKGRLIVIFGATGGRDKSKRPLMGKVVSRTANIALITADDTRNEDIGDINEQIISGISPQNSLFFDYTQPDLNKNLTKIYSLSKNRFVYFNIPNRQDAFNLALKMAKAGDTVIACGKGHETTILHGTTEYPWSEAQAFRTAVNNRN